MGKLRKAFLDVNPLLKITEEEMLRAVVLGNTARVRKYLTQGGDPNAVSPDAPNNTALAMAAQNGRDDIIALLAEFGADMNRTSGTDRCTPLFYAIINNKPAAAAKLVKCGASPLTPPTPRLPKIGGIEDQPQMLPAEYAVYAGHNDVANSIINATTDKNSRQLQANAAMFQAIVKHNAKLVETLIDAGADIHAPDRSGVPPLLRAIFCDDDQIATLLMERGANPIQLSPDNKLSPAKMLSGKAYAMPNTRAAIQTWRNTRLHRIYAMKHGHMKGMS